MKRDSPLSRPLRELFDVASEQGTRAYNRGARRNENPFRTIERARSGWDAGWCAAENLNIQRESAA